MAPAQALAHCPLALEAATGDRPSERSLIGRILGPFFRGSMLDPKPFSRNSPTDPALVVSGQRDFEREKARLAAVIRKFAAAGPDAASCHLHAFLGRLTGDEWGRIQHRHLDHHPTQFGAA